MRRTRLIALLAVTALSLMACQADDDPEVTEDSTPTPAETATDDGTGGAVDDDVLERVAEAAGNTVDEGTAHFTITLGDATTTGTTGSTGTDVTTTPSPTPDDGATTTPSPTPDDDAMGMTGTTGQSDVTVEGEVDFDAELRELQFVGPQGQLAMIIDGDELYVQLPATEEGEWARIDLSELADEDVGFGGPAGLPFQDPHRTLDVLRDAAVEARELDGGATAGASPTPTDGFGATETETDGFGATETPTDGFGATETETDGFGATETETETDGFGATETETETDGFGATETETPDDTTAGGHFLVVIDLEEAGDLTDGGDQFTTMAEQHGIETLDMEIWIDDEERIERVTYTLPLSEARVEGEVEEEEAEAEAEVDPQQDLVVTIAYHNFGAEVDITVPDSDEVVDLDEDELRRMMQGGTGTDTGTGTTGTTGTASPTPTSSPGPTLSPSPTDSPSPTETETE